MDAWTNYNSRLPIGHDVLGLVPPHDGRRHADRTVHREDERARTAQTQHLKVDESSGHIKNHIHGMSYR